MMAIDRLKKLVENDFDAVNNLIINTIQSQIGLIDDLSHHIIESGGKRLRPLLVLLSSRACGYRGEEKNHITLAAMIEFFHTATLLHDDVVDESTLRRGRETANTIWGSKASILVGDYLFTQSVQLMVDVNHTKILRLLAKTAHQISCGEIRQLANRHNPSLQMEDYFAVIEAKTARLFAAAAAIGPLLSNSEQQLETALYNYGFHLGNAFQLIDDALDYSSNVKTIGKNIGDDLADGKITLPLLYTLQHCKPEQKTLIEDSIKQGTLANLAEIIATIQETNAVEFTRNYAASEVDKALSALQSLPDTVYKEALCALAQFALERDH